MELAGGARPFLSSWECALGDLWRESRDSPFTSFEICVIDVRAGVHMTGGLWKAVCQVAGHGPLVPEPEAAAWQ